jgi:hypothetical protein
MSVNGMGPPEPLYYSNMSPCINGTSALGNVNGSQISYLRCVIPFTCPPGYAVYNGAPIQAGFGNNCQKIPSKQNVNLAQFESPICPSGKQLISINGYQKVCVKPE